MKCVYIYHIVQWAIVPLVDTSAKFCTEPGLNILKAFQVSSPNQTRTPRFEQIQNGHHFVEKGVSKVKYDIQTISRPQVH